MIHTIAYTVNGREFTHTGSGESLTRFLRNLERGKVPYRFVNEANRHTVSGLFAGIVLNPN